jgi:hypothetical protein
MIVKIRLTRDSVAAGDDADAPHERFILFDVGDLCTARFVSELANGYLAKINGVGHSWSAFLNQELVATVTATDVIPHVETVTIAPDNDLYFQYHSATF